MSRTAPLWVTLIVNGKWRAGAMLSLTEAATPFWVIDGVLGCLPAANSNERLRVL